VIGDECLSFRDKEIHIFPLVRHQKSARKDGGHGYFLRRLVRRRFLVVFVDASIPSRSAALRGA
jgi:hypothetical protein